MVILVLKLPVQRIDALLFKVELFTFQAGQYNLNTLVIILLKIEVYQRYPIVHYQSFHCVSYSKITLSYFETHMIKVFMKSFPLLSVNRLSY